jgi:tryptophanyl-tRNA synthetase
MVRAVTLQQVAVLIAAGLDPGRYTLFVQSHIPAHAELHWLPEATAYDGELPAAAGADIQVKAPGRS